MFRHYLKRLAILGLISVLAPISTARATVCTTVRSGAWTAPSVWVSGIRPQLGDTAIVSLGDSVGLDSSTPPLGRVIIEGFLNFGSDTLFLNAPAADTAIIVIGTLNAGSGWFADSLRPTIHCLAGSLFRTRAIVPLPDSSIFDSSQSPFFALDSGSTFEYYSNNLDAIDITYLLNNIAGHAYWNLTLTDMVAKYRANPLWILGTLTIGFGAGINADYTSDTVTISGDVRNENSGESGSPGAGLHGCGMLSLGDETWIFDARSAGIRKNTCHWSGPSQLGNIIIRPSTILSVRFLNDTACDSLDVLGHFLEDSTPCGGELIGRVYSETPLTLFAANPVDTFAGLTIRSGTAPYLGRTRIIRTTGYPPPGANRDNSPILRYYYISPGDGPQLGSPDTIAMQVDCDEWNGSDPTMLHFWRSFDRGATWAYSGLTSFDPQSNTFVWDTSVLGWPNDSGGFYWMLSEGYTDTPLPVELEYFTAEESANCVSLSWKTGSETNLAGFELDRIAGNDSETIAALWNDDSLRARSPSGANYYYTDDDAPAGSLRYDLYEITQDGLREWLASRTPSEAPSPAPLSIGNPIYERGELEFSLSAPDEVTIRLTDALGRTVFSKTAAAGIGNIIIPVSLVPGVYFLEARSLGNKAIAKFIGLEGH